MRAINHALTGALIGLTVSEPAIALPAALLSHYVLDAIPHYDKVSNQVSIKIKEKWHRSKLFKQMLVVDAALCLLLVVVLVITRPKHWLTACFCSFLAAAPDMLSINRWLHALRHKKWRGGLYSRFAGTIQWFERPIGWVVEVAWLIAMIILITPFFR